MKYIKVIILCCLVMSCKENPARENNANKEKVAVGVGDSIPQKKAEPKKVFRSLENLTDTTFVRLADFSDGFAYDLRYATENNFLKEKVYDCAECYTRVKTVRALLAANAAFKKVGSR